MQEPQNSPQRTEPEVVYIGEKPPILTSFSDLYLRPLRFFSDTVAKGYRPLFALVVWCVGIANAMDRIDQELLKQDIGTRHGFSLYPSLLGSWAAYWAFVLVLGAIGGFFIYKIGSWWYDKRLRMCGSTTHDRDAANTVYIYTSFIFAFPYIAYTVAQTLLYPDYGTAYAADDMFALSALLLLIFPFWAVFNSHRTVAEFFTVERGKARLWFLILPFIVYIAAFGVIATVLVLTGLKDAVQG